jgi:hypothetical protein
VEIHLDNKSFIFSQSFSFLMKELGLLHIPDDPKMLPVSTASIMRPGSMEFLMRLRTIRMPMDPKVPGLSCWMSFADEGARAVFAARRNRNKIVGG